MYSQPDNKLQSADEILAYLQKNWPQTQQKYNEVVQDFQHLHHLVYTLSTKFCVPFVRIASYIPVNESRVRAVVNSVAKKVTKGVRGGATS